MLPANFLPNSDSFVDTATVDLNLVVRGTSVEPASRRWLCPVSVLPARRILSDRQCCLAANSVSSARLPILSVAFGGHVICLPFPSSLPQNDAACQLSAGQR